MTDDEKKLETERRTAVEDWNASKTFPTMVSGMLSQFGVTMKDAWKKGHFDADGTDIEKDSRPRSYYTVMNDMQYYMTSCRSARKNLQSLKDLGTLHDRNGWASKQKALEVWNGKYKNKRVSISVDSRAAFESMLSESYRYQIENWDEYEDSGLHVTATYKHQLEKVGFSGWFKVAGKDMFFVRTLETKDAPWASENNIEVRRVIAAQPIRKKTSYRSVSDALMYHNNVWLLTHKSYDGSVICAANKDFGRARSLMEQYLKAGVLNELDGLL